MVDTMTTKDLDRLLPLTHEERAICYAIEHNEHIHIAQALAYLHWARARGCALDAPRQTTLPVPDAPVVGEALAIVDAELATLEPPPGSWEELARMEQEYRTDDEDNEEGALT